jgi:hypothetical protein
MTHGVTNMRDPDEENVGGLTDKECYDKFSDDNDIKNMLYRTWNGVKCHYLKMFYACLLGGVISNRRGTVT